MYMQEGFGSTMAKVPTRGETSGLLPGLLKVCHDCAKKIPGIAVDLVVLVVLQSGPRPVG